MKSCPKCGGQLLPDFEEGKKCLQCGWIPPAPETLALVDELNQNPHLVAMRHIKANGGVSKEHKAVLSSPWRGVRRENE